MRESSASQQQGPKHEYRMGHSRATTASHESRTVDSDAAFLAPYIKPNHRILDAGCGPGTITLGFIPLVPSGEVVGADYSGEVIERARELAAAQGLGDKVTFTQGNLLEGLPFDDDSFDVVFASQVFGHIQPEVHTIAALKECRRVLKPGGILAARDGAYIHFYPFSEELNRLWTSNMFRGIQVDGFVGMNMRGLLRKAGFDVENPEKAKLGGGTTVYASREKCEWWANTLARRLTRGEKFRDSWTKVGISDAECDETVELLQKWGKHEDAFYGLLQSESLVWK